MGETGRSKSFFNNPLAVVLLLSGVFFVFFLLFSAGLFVGRGPATKKAMTSGKLFQTSGRVGVVELNGVILDSKKILERLEDFEEDDRVKAVVLRLNSPGGAVGPSQEIHQAVQAFKKPLVVSMGSVAASGAYYIACGAKKVFANAGTITGSIGVIMEFINLEKLYEWAKVKRYSVKTGKFKDVGADYKDLSEEDRALLQAMVDDVLAQFRRAVVEGRKLTEDQVVAVSDGRIFSGAQAKARGLVDELGSLQDAVREAASLAKIEGKPEVVYPERRKSRIWDLLGEGFPESAEESEASGGGWLAQVLNSIGRSIAPSSTPAPGIYWIWAGAR
jgi:protease-4